MKLLSKIIFHVALREQFSAWGAIPKAALIDFLERYFGEAKPSTLAWRLYELTQEGVLVRTGYGQYQINDRSTYQPNLSPTLRKISERIKAKFPSPIVAYGIRGYWLI